MHVVHKIGRVFHPKPQRIDECNLMTTTPIGERIGEIVAALLLPPHRVTHMMMRFLPMIIRLLRKARLSFSLSFVVLELLVAGSCSRFEKHWRWLAIEIVSY